ncbi:MFS transporter [Streptomyces sp. NPDC048506]|uniref:MFS transporter n=1 Tax=Streptomyces sp. NPDC048506 TaxID=3155028 RepID=UPI003434DAC0
MTNDQAGAAAVPFTARKLAVFNLVLGVDHVFGCLGLFSLMPVLGVLLSRQTSGGSMVVGTGLFIYTAAAGISALLVNHWLPRFPYVVGMTAGLCLSALGFGLLPYVHGPVPLVALLAVAGLGVSIHFILSRVMIAELVTDDIGRHRIYSMLQIAVNIAAAIGPFAASLLYSTGSDGRLLLGLVALSYVLAAVSLLFGLPRGLRPPPTSGQWPISRAALMSVLRHRIGLRVVVTTVTGSFLYAQFFSAFALLVAHEIRTGAVRAVLLAGPAVTIVALQTAVTAVVSRLMKRGLRPLVMLGSATLMFAAAMALLGFGLPVAVAAGVSVAVFSVAEMLFTPMVSTAFAGLPIASSLEAFNIRQVSWTLGEALGSLSGGALFLFCYEHGHQGTYWLVLAGVTAVGMPLLLLSARSRTDAQESAAPLSASATK